MPFDYTYTHTLTNTYLPPYGFWISLIYYIYLNMYTRTNYDMVRCFEGAPYRLHQHISAQTHKFVYAQRTTHIQIAWISSFYERIVILYWNGPISLFTTAKYSLEMHENQGYKFRATFHLINNNLEIFAIEWRWFAVGGHELGLCSQLYNELFVKFWNLKGTQKYRLQLCTWLCWI